MHAPRLMTTGPGGLVIRSREIRLGPHARSGTIKRRWPFATLEIYIHPRTYAAIRGERRACTRARYARMLSVFSLRIPRSILALSFSFRARSPFLRFSASSSSSSSYPLFVALLRRAVSRLTEARNTVPDPKGTRLHIQRTLLKRNFISEPSEVKIWQALQYYICYILLIWIFIRKRNKRQKVYV